MSDLSILNKLRENAKLTIINYLNRNYAIFNGVVYKRDSNDLRNLGDHDMVKKIMTTSGLDMKLTIEIINEWYLNSFKE